VAALNLATSSAGTRPRSFTSMPCALTHADLSVVYSARRCPASAPSWPPRTAPRPPRRTHIARQRIPQCLSVLGVQVDLIFGAVQPEADRPLSLAAIKVVDQKVCIFWATDASFRH
jgi:hypothetical protein